MLTGRGPHLGDDAAETLRAVPEFRAHLPPGTPHGLAAVVRQAMARDPADRFPSVQALRLALQAFLEERTADNLARQAGLQLLALEHDLEAEAPDRQQVYRHFGATRFGFQQALEAWPDHGEAAACLRRALIRMARFELDQGDPRAAQVHLAEVEDPPPELLARRDALQAAQARAEAEVQRLRADQDPALGQRTRVFVFSLVTIGWTFIPLLAWVLDLPLTHRRLLQTHGIMLVVVVGLVIWARDSLGRTSLNRTVAHMLVVVQLFLVVSLWIGRGLGLSPEQVTITHDLLFGAVAALLIERVGRIAALPAVAYTLAAAAAVVRPDWIAPLNAVCNAVVSWLIFRAWGRRVVDQMGSVQAALFSPASPPPDRGPPGAPPGGRGPR
ncbi:hypothetical protein L6R53_08260 [Myxococcota bacterium]|nr:hypothetical protein [Myxococcota bacterium]